MILALDTSTTACTAALFDAQGVLVGRRDEMIGRGHAERLVPMIAELVEGYLPSAILVGVGPGSFTGIRVGIAAAHGLAIGWQVPVHGLSSLALLAAGAPGDGPVAVAVSGGHGELFCQMFERGPLRPASALMNAAPTVLAGQVDCPLVVGSGAAALVEARRSGEALALFPSAADALALPEALRALEPKPVYARAPDAKPSAVRVAQPA